MFGKTILIIVALALFVAGCSSNDKADAGGGDGDGDGDGSVTVCSGSDWTSLGHDMGSTFHACAETKITRENVGTLVEKWSAKMDGSSTGSPAVVGDTVYYASFGYQADGLPAHRNIAAFDVADGTERWQAANTYGGVQGSVAAADGSLYVMESGSIRKWDAARGVSEWSAIALTIGGQIQYAMASTPLVVGDKLYVGTASGQEALLNPGEQATFRGEMIALNLDGTEAWRFQTVEAPSNGAPIWSSASADPEMGLLFMTTGNNYTGIASDTSNAIIAVDLESGDLMWKYQAVANDVFIQRPFPSGGPGPDYDFGANPILFEANGRKLVGAGSKSGSFYAVDRATGQEVWTSEVGMGCAAGGILNNGAYDGKYIYVSNWPCEGEATLAAIDPNGGSVVWRKQLPEQSWAPITVANGVGFIPSQNTLYAFDTDNGDTLLQREFPGSICSGSVVSDGRLFVGSGTPDQFNGFGGVIDGDTFHVLGLP